MHNFVERKMPIRDRELRERAATAGLRMVGNRPFGSITLADIAERLSRVVGEEVCERTLRRRYRTPARLIFGEPWWLPSPGDLIAEVTKPRIAPEGPMWPSGPEAEAADVIEEDDFDWPPAEFFTDAGIADPLGDPEYVSPLPLSIRELLEDLHVVITRHLLATGFAGHLNTIARVAGDEPEIAAWLAFSREQYAERLTPRLAVLIGDPAPVAARAFTDLCHRLEPRVGDLGTALLELRAGIGTTRAAADAGAALAQERLIAVAGVSGILSTVDRIRELPNRRTVRPPISVDGMLPYRAPYRATKR